MSRKNGSEVSLPTLHSFTFGDFIDGHQVTIHCADLIHLAAVKDWNSLSERLLSDRNNGKSEIKRCSCKAVCSWLDEGETCTDCENGEQWHAVTESSCMAEYLRLKFGDENGVSNSSRNSTGCSRDKLSLLTALHLACIFNNAGVVKLLLRDATNNDAEYVNSPDSDGRTALNYAAYIGNSSVVKMLLKRGAKFTRNDPSGLSPLDVAVQNGHVNVVRQFVRELSNPLSQNVERIASRHVAYEKQQTKDCNSLLHVASIVGDVDALRAVAKGNDVVKHTNAIGWTPIHCAAIAGRVDVLTKLNDVSARSAFVSTASVYNVRDAQGFTALHLAVKTNNAQVIPLLKAANPEQDNDDGLSPLHLAAQLSSDDELSAILETFYAEQSEQSRDIDHQDSSGRSALHISIAAGMTNKVRMLLARGANPWKRCRNGITAMHQLAKARIGDDSTNERIFGLLADNSVRWWLAKKAMKNLLVSQDVERDAVIEMTCGTPYKDLNVLLFAAKVKAFSLLKVISKSKFFDSDQGRDVTYMTNETTPRGKLGNATAPEKSVIEYIVKSMPARDAAQLLTCEPFEQLLYPYMRLHKLTCLMLFVVHAVHMGLFTAKTIQFDDWLRESFNVTHRTHLHTERANPDFWAFLVWPVICLIGALVKIVWRTKDTYDHYRKSESDISYGEYVKRCAIRLFYQVQSEGLALLFFCSTVAWYIWYCHCVDKHAYAVSLTLVYIIGWSYTTTFTVFLQRTSEIIYAVRTILMKDVTVFFVIYGFQLLSFSLSTYVLTVEDMIPDQKKDMPFFEIIYSMFSRMLRSEVESDDIKNISFDSWYSTFVGIVLMLYGTISAVVLVNLLIAMMGHTYDNALEQAKLDVRVDTFWILGEIIEKERLWTRPGRCLRWVLRSLAGDRWPTKKMLKATMSSPRYFLEVKP